MQKCAAMKQILFEYIAGSIKLSFYKVFKNTTFVGSNHNLSLLVIQVCNPYIFSDTIFIARAVSAENHSLVCAIYNSLQLGYENFPAMHYLGKSSPVTYDKIGPLQVIFFK